MIASHQETWFSVNRRVAEPRARLFCFAHAGGSASLFQRWHRDLPRDIEVVGIQLPGHGHRRSEGVVSDLRLILDELLPAMIPHLDRPYVLLGHSMGALIAFELAIRLQERCRQEPAHVVLAAGRPPHEAPRITPMHALSRRGFVARLRALSALPEDLLREEAFLDAILPVLRADFALVETWEHRPSSLLTMPVTVFGGDSDPLIDRETLLGWRRYTEGDFEIVEMAGNHFFPFNRQQEFLRMVSRIPALAAADCAASRG